MSKWTVSPATVRHESTWNDEAFWVELKLQLTAGEELKMQSAGFKSYNTSGMSDKRKKRGAQQDTENSGKIDIDFSRLHLSRIMAYVIDWSLEEDGKKLRINEDVVSSLHPGMVEALNEVINEHEETREEEKKVSSGKKE